MILHNMYNGLTIPSLARCSDWLIKNGSRFKEGEGEKILENLLTQKVTHANPQETVSFLIDLGTDPCYKNPKTGNQVNKLHLITHLAHFAHLTLLTLSSRSTTHHVTPSLPKW